MLTKSLIALTLALTSDGGMAYGSLSADKPIRLSFEVSAEDAPSELGMSARQDVVDFAAARRHGTTPRFGASGSTRLTLQTAMAVQGGDNFLFLGGFGFEHFIADDLSLVSQFNGVYVDQDGPEASGANIVLLLRWHYYAADSWSAYFEAGAGIAWFTEEVPENGSQYNFTPQAAAGITFDIGGENRGHVAIGWHHISNAQSFNDNPGRDSVAVHFGLSFPF